MTELETRIMKLMPLWILLLIFASAGVQVMYPTVDVIAILDEPWVHNLLIAMGLGGIPLSILKRLIAGAKDADAIKAEVGRILNPPADKKSSKEDN